MKLEKGLGLNVMTLLCIFIEGNLKVFVFMCALRDDIGLSDEKHLFVLHVRKGS